MNNILKKIVLFSVLIFVQDSYCASEPDVKIFGIATDKNARPSIQDYIKIVLETNKIPFFGIFNSHGEKGYDIAKYVGDNLYNEIIKDYVENNDIQKAIKNGFLKTDESLDKNISSESGATAAIALIKDKKIYIAWVGDSKAIKITKDWRGIDLSTDHKPNREDEKERIEKEGGKVKNVGRVFRVYKKTGGYMIGGLIISRAFGDKKLRPVVTSEPEIESYPIDLDDNYLILTSGTVYDIISTKDITNFIKENSKLNFNLNNLAHMLLEEVKKRGGRDNISVIIINLKNLFESLNREKELELKKEKELMTISNFIEKKIDEVDAAIEKEKVAAVKEKSEKAMNRIRSYESRLNFILNNFINNKRYYESGIGKHSIKTINNLIENINNLNKVLEKLADDVRK